MKQLNEKQIKYLIRLVVREENDALTPTSQKWCEEVHGVLSEMLAVLPTSRAVDATPTSAADSESNNGVRH